MFSKDHACLNLKGMPVSTPVPLTEAKRRIVDRLKRVDDATAAELAGPIAATLAARGPSVSTNVRVASRIRSVSCFRGGATI